ncbi:MAG: hypothetical protein LC687_03590, partial [Actinobacteria bacterium]|nr:hypothetical protein [Actinomycetota bacterium]
MPSRQYVYSIAFDLGMARSQATAMRAIMQTSLQNIPVTVNAAQTSQAASSIAQTTSATDELRQSISLLRQVFQSGKEIVTFTSDLAQLGYAYQRVHEAQAHFAGSSEEVERRLMRFQQITGGAISEFQALHISNRMAALGLANTTAELERLIKFATISSRVMGRDLRQQIEDIALAASNLSFVRLDQLGISATLVRNRIVELRAADSDLTREQAFLSAALEIGEQNFMGIEGSAINAASGMEKVGAAFQNLKKDMGLVLAEPVSEFLSALADAMNPQLVGENVDDIIDEVK